MALRPEIALQVQQPEPFDVLGQYGRVVSLRDMIQTNDIRRREMEAREQQTRIENENMRRQQEEQKAIQEALADGGADKWDGSIAKLRQLGTPTAMKYAADLETTIANQRKAKAEAEAQAIGTARKQLEDFGNALVILDTTPEPQKPAAYSMIIRDFKGRKMLPEGMEVPEQYDPAWVDIRRAEVTNAAERLAQLEEKRKATQFATELPGKQADSAMKVANAQFAANDPNLLTPEQRAAADARSVDDARAAEHFAETKRHNRILEAKAGDRERIVQIAGENGTAVWVRESEAIGKPAAQAARSITGQERQALGFYNRMKEATDTITGVEDSVAKAGIGTQARLKFAPNFAQSEQGQIYNQARRAFTEARLRKESGAAIPDHEYKNDERTYFAQPGDSPKVIEQKRKARETVMLSVANSAGRAYEEWYGEPLAKPADNRGGGGSSAASQSPVIKWGKDRNGNPVRLGN